MFTVYEDLMTMTVHVFMKFNGDYDILPLSHNVGRFFTSVQCQKTFYIKEQRE